MNRMTTCLWYDGAAEQATAFYAGLFPDTHVGHVLRSPVDYPAGKAGDVLTVEFTLLGQPALALNGGPGHPFTDAVSFQVHTDTQEETDRYWNALVADGGAPVACGWCRDRWGLSWQVVPRQLTAALSNPDHAAAQRAMVAMMGMVRIDIAAIEAAVAGGAGAQ